MSSIFVLVILFFTGSLIAFTKGDQQILRAVPATIMGYVVILYIFGLLGYLDTGTIFIFCVVCGIYLLCGYLIYKKGEFRKTLPELCKNFMIVFIFLYMICILDRGMLVRGWDEFSYWADVVKAMFFLDDLATDPVSQCSFRDYPPGMALLQYLFMEIQSLIQRSKMYVEWRLYAVWHMVLLGTLFPLFGDKRLKKTALLSVTVVLLSTCMFYFPDLFGILTIDAIVAVIAAYVFAWILLADIKDHIYDLSVILGCVFLVLLKEIGMAFACICAMVYFFDRLDRPFFSRKRITSLFPLCAVFLTWFSWKWELNREHVGNTFSSEINLSEYIRMLLFRDGKDYKQTVVNSSLSAFFEKRSWAGPVGISYALILLFLIAIAILSLLIIRKKSADGHRAFVRMLWFYGGAFGVVVLYAVFIGAMYAYKFSQYEAIHLASYERYMNLCFLFLSVIIILSACYSFVLIDSGSLILAVWVLCSFLMVDNRSITGLVSGENARDGMEFFQFYEPVLKQIEGHCKETDRLCVLSRGDRGQDLLVMKYYCRQIVTVETGLPFSLGGPVDDEDIWSKDITPDDFMDELLQDDVTHVALFDIGEDFDINYASLFENAEDIEEKSLYMVDENKRLLIRCR